jgi:myo-inositol 2-dehydrogenase/D-chiro-inositol 1-dehydrogenase
VGYHHAYRAVDYAGSRAKRVYARVGRHVQDIEVEDTALLLIEHEGGATTSLQVGWSAPAGGISVNEVLGTAGQIRFGGTDAPVSLWSRETGEWTQPPVDPEGRDELGFPLVVERFLDAIQTGGDVPVSGDDARHILAIVLAAYESGRTGEPVEVA